MVDAEQSASFEEGYINESDPSILRFLIASRHVPSPFLNSNISTACTAML